MPLASLPDGASPRSDDVFDRRPDSAAIGLIALCSGQGVKSRWRFARFSPGTDMVSYIPVLTSLLSVFFLSRIVPHYLAKRSPYLLWWSLGVLTFGLGTLTESINAVFVWSEWNTKIWCIVGALLGGYPLAQGTIYLLTNKRFADISALVCTVGILLASVCVLASPIELPANFDQRLTGSVLQLNWA